MICNFYRMVNQSMDTGSFGGVVFDLASNLLLKKVVYRQTPARTL